MKGFSFSEEWEIFVLTSVASMALRICRLSQKLIPNIWVMYLSFSVSFIKFECQHHQSLQFRREKSPNLFLTIHEKQSWLNTEPDVPKAVIITVDIWPYVHHRFSPWCVSSDCGQLKDRLMLYFSIPASRIWYFYWNRSREWHCISHDLILDLRPESSHCKDETTFSVDSGYYPTPAALTRLKDETTFSVKISLQSDLKV